MAPRTPLLPRDPEHSLHRLEGGPSSVRCLRSQLVTGALVSLALFAVPLYLLRRPSSAPAESAAPLGAEVFGGVIRAPVDAGNPDADLRLGPVTRVRCGASRARANSRGARCDALPQFEAALRRAIESNAECVARRDESGSINYVLEVDFSAARLNVFAGKSGTWRGRRAKAGVECVEGALPEPRWSAIAHRHAYYAIAILATYPAADRVVESMPAFD